MDVFWHLAEDDVSVRQKAVIDLVDGIKAQQVIDLKEAAKNSTEVKKTIDGIDLPLDYALNRLVKGLASGRQSARQGFAAGLTQVLLTFKEISTDIVVKIAKQVAVTASSYIGNEKRDYELGVAFLLLVFSRVKRVHDLPNEFLESQMKVLLGLQKSHPQMAEMCVDTLIHVSKDLTESQLSSFFLPTIVAKLPATFSDMKPHDLSLAIAVHNIHNRFPSVLDKVKNVPGYIVNIFAPINHGPVYGVLEKTFAAYPMIHSVWSHTIDTLAHETVLSENATAYHASVFSVTGKTSALVTFWVDVIYNLIAKAFSYNKKSYALSILALAIQTLFSYTKANTDIDTEAKLAWFSQQLSSLFQTDFTKLFMAHLKEKTAPCHNDALKVYETLLTVGTAAQPTAIAIISLLSNPEHGGHRQFDVKTHKSLLKTLQKSLDDEGSTAYLASVFDTFLQAESIAEKDVRAAAEATKAHEAVLRAELAELQTKEDKEAVTKKEEELSAFMENTIGDVETFLESAEAKAAVVSTCESLQLWALDQIAEICKNARLIATTLEKKGDDKSKNVNVTDRINVCLRFLFRNAFFAAPAAAPAKAKKTKKAAKESTFVSNNVVVPVSEKIRRGCVVAFLSLLSDLLGQSLAHNPKNRKAGSEVDRAGAVWGENVLEYWSELEMNGYTINLGEEEFNEGTVLALNTIRGLLTSIQKNIQANVPTEKKPFTADDLRRVKLVRLRAMYLFAVHLTILLLSDQTDFAPIIMDLEQVFVRAFPAKKKGAEEEEEDDTAWIEVLVDMLLSLLVKPSALLRTLTLKVFSSFSSDLNVSAVDDIMRVLVSVKEDMDDAEEVDDDEDDEDMEEDLEIEVEEDEDEEEEEEEEEKKEVKAIKKATKAKSGDDENDLGSDALEITKRRWDPMSGSLEDDDNEEKEEKDDDLDFGAALRGEEDDDSDEELGLSALTDMLSNPAFHSSHDGYQSAEDKALQELVKMKKARNTTHRDLKREATHFKLRVLDLVEVLVKKQGNSALVLRLYEPLIAVMQNTIGPEMRALHDRVFSLYTHKLCKPFPLAPLPALPSFVQNGVVVAPTDEAAAEEALVAEVSNANLVKDVLDARFRAVKTAQGAELLGMEVAAITRLINQYLSAPADVKEWTEVTAAVGTPLAPTDAKPKKGKKAATAVPAVDTNAVLAKLKETRVAYISKKIQALLVIYLFNKRSSLTHRFFADLIAKSAPVMTTPTIAAAVAKAVLNAPSTYVRTEALNLISALLRHKNAIKGGNEAILSFLDIFRAVLEEANKKGVAALSVIADAAFVKGVKSEVDAQIKEELGDANKNNKKKAKDDVKIGGVKVQKNYMTTLGNVYTQFVQMYRATETALGKTPSMEVPKKDKKSKKETKKEKKEEVIKEEAVTKTEDETKVESSLQPTTDAEPKTKKAKKEKAKSKAPVADADEDVEIVEKPVKKAKKAKKNE